jgi:hypothetical protein
VATRTCGECQREFVPSSGHLRCPACRSKDVCDCGLPKQVGSRVCTQCATRAGSSNGNWRGGRIRHKKGYVMIKSRSHPRGGNSGYVFEHILVAERVLGRYLLPDETVHHRNGIRDDNRAENLELWTRPQPSGIRVSDAIIWARDILERYDGGGPPPTTLTRR